MKDEIRSPTFYLPNFSDDMGAGHIFANKSREGGLPALPVFQAKWGQQYLMIVFPNPTEQGTAVFIQIEIIF
jgi:hypothetical protein